MVTIKATSGVNCNNQLLVHLDVTHNTMYKISTNNHISSWQLIQSTAKPLRYYYCVFIKIVWILFESYDVEKMTIVSGIETWPDFDFCFIVSFFQLICMNHQQPLLWQISGVLTSTSNHFWASYVINNNCDYFPQMIS